MKLGWQILPFLLCLLAACYCLPSNSQNNQPEYVVRDAYIDNEGEGLKESEELSDHHDTDVQELIWRDITEAITKLDAEHGHDEDESKHHDDQDSHDGDHSHGDHGHGDHPHDDDGKEHDHDHNEEDDSSSSSSSSEEEKEPTSAFPCNVPTAHSAIPESVHRLRPQDVKVIAALGDSLTAANGGNAATILEVLKQYRGLAFSIGGEGSIEDGVGTLPNFIRKYNPNLTGFSTGIGKAGSEEAHLNVAVPGAVAKGMPKQATTLVDLMISDPKVDFEKDWKVISLFIGGNDLCRSCRRWATFSDPETYIGYIREALDILEAEVPRAFVNLVSIVDVTELIKLNSDICRISQPLLCPCARQATEATYEMARKYQRLIQELVEGGRYDKRSDFTVVVQPFATRTTIPLNEKGEYDRSYFAPDCFHFSKKAHSAAGEALWNNMLEPVGGKSEEWSPGEPVSCPTTEHPYFYTRENSVESPDDQDDDVDKSPVVDYDDSWTEKWPIILVVGLTAIVLVTLLIGVICMTSSRKKQKKIDPNVFLYYPEKTKSELEPIKYPTK